MRSWTKQTHKNVLENFFYCSFLHKIYKVEIHFFSTSSCSWEAICSRCLLLCFSRSLTSDHLKRRIIYWLLILVSNILSLNIFSTDAVNLARSTVQTANSHSIPFFHFTSTLLLFSFSIHHTIRFRINKYFSVCKSKLNVKWRRRGRRFRTDLDQKLWEVPLHALQMLSPGPGNMIQFIVEVFFSEIFWLLLVFSYFINFEKEFVICYCLSLLLPSFFSLKFESFALGRALSWMRWWSLGIDMQTWALTIYKFKFYFDILEGKRPSRTPFSVSFTSSRMMSADIHTFRSRAAQLDWLWSVSFCLLRKSVASDLYSHYFLSQPGYVRITKCLLSFFLLIFIFPIFSGYLFVLLEQSSRPRLKGHCQRLKNHHNHCCHSSPSFPQQVTSHRSEMSYFALLSIHTVVHCRSHTINISHLSKLIHIWCGHLFMLWSFNMLENHRMDI